MQVRPGGARDFETPVDEVLFEVVVWTREQGHWVEHDYGIVDCDVHDAIEFAGFRTPEDGQYELRVCYRDEATGNGMSVWLSGDMPEELRGEPQPYTAPDPPSTDEGHQT